MVIWVFLLTMKALKITYRSRTLFRHLVAAILEPVERCQLEQARFQWQQGVLTQGM